MKSIKCQYQYAINQNFREGMDKHSLKKMDTSHTNIYSYSEKFRLLDVANSLGTFIKNNFGEIRYIVDIQPQHIQAFLNSKQNCTQNTINSYIQSLKKLERVSNKCYGLAKNNLNQIVTPNVTKENSSRGATHPITREAYEKILSYSLNNPSKSGNALLLDYACSLSSNSNISHAFRVEELARIKLENISLDGIITITNAKGGKTYQTHCPNVDFLKSIIDKQYDPQGKFLFAISGASINKYLWRVCSKLDIGDKYSFHDIRRLHAQDFYDSKRNLGISPHNALLQTSLYLNHNSKREYMLMASYLNNVW